LARIRFEIVMRRSQKRPFRVFPQECVSRVGGWRGGAIML
jgi:hypothetical protein